MADKLDVKQGTLALMILKTLEAMGEMHGYGIPIYVNIKYPWTWHGVAPSPPIVPADDPNNTVNSYRRTFDVPKRKQIVYDIQRFLAEQGLFGVNGSVKVVSAWDAHIKNFMPNNGFDFGGRLMAAWIDK